MWDSPTHYALALSSLYHFAFFIASPTFFNRSDTTLSCPADLSFRNLPTAFFTSPLVTPCSFEGVVHQISQLLLQLYCAHSVHSQSVALHPRTPTPTHTHSIITEHSYYRNIQSKYCRHILETHSTQRLSSIHSSWSLVKSDCDLPEYTKVCHCWRCLWSVFVCAKLPSARDSYETLV